MIPDSSCGINLPTKFNFTIESLLYFTFWDWLLFSNGHFGRYKASLYIFIAIVINLVLIIFLKLFVRIVIIL